MWLSSYLPRGVAIERISFKKGVNNKFVQVLNIVSGNVVGANDLVQGEQGNIVVIDKVCMDLGG